VPGTDSGQTHTYSTAADARIAIGALFVIGILCLIPAVSANLIVRIVIPVFGFLFFIVPAIALLRKNSFEPVAVTPESLVLPMSRREVVTLPLGTVAGIGGTDGVSAILTVVAADGQTYRCGAVSCGGGGNMTKFDRTVRAIWDDVRTHQGDAGPLATLQGDFGSPLPNFG
jgi:hypothetical protein